MANTVDPDETAHEDITFVQKHLIWGSGGMGGSGKSGAEKVKYTKIHFFCNAYSW